MEDHTLLNGRTQRVCVPLITVLQLSLALFTLFPEGLRPSPPSPRPSALPPPVTSPPPPHLPAPAARLPPPRRGGRAPPGLPRGTAPRRPCSPRDGQGRDARAAPRRRARAPEVDRGRHARRPTPAPAVGHGHVRDGAHRMSMGCPCLLQGRRTCVRRPRERRCNKYWAEITDMDTR